ncbi:hypothetical protein BH23CHL2_BH23CHL2_02160 [soil metagenome]
MEEPTTTTTSDERLTSTPEPTTTSLLRSASGTSTLLHRWGTPASDQRYVAETLEWIAEELGTKRARFVRLLPSGVWVVQTVVQGKIVAQPADRAEIAMAWAVGLSRDIYSASRPRVMTFDGGGIRPIAVTTYIAIPVLCQQGLAGIIEAAGGLKPGAERIARAAGERLADFATRLMFDPGLRSEPRVTLETECDITGGLSSNNFTHLSAVEWDFIDALIHPKKLGEIAEELDWPEQAVLDMARELVARGVITLRTPTDVLTTSTTSLLSDPSEISVSA